MNCILFPQDAPMQLERGDPRLDHIIKVLRTKEGGEIYAGNVNGKLNVCTLSFTNEGINFH